MKTMTRIVWLCAGISLLAASAHAQATSPATEKFFVNANVGGQLAKRTLTTVATKDVYDEVATLESTQPIAAGVTFDLGLGYRIWGDVYAGVVITRFSDTGDASYTAKVPNPVVFGLLATTTGSQTSLDRTELGFHPNVTWARPLRDKIDIALSVGAAFINVKQQMVNNFDVPAGTQSIVPLVGEESGTAKGFFGQADFIYNLKARYGVGGFVRYAGGKVDLPSAPDQNAGGVQAGGGIRLRF